jgi:uncharacterized membrane protein
VRLIGDSNDCIFSNYFCGFGAGGCTGRFYCYYLGLIVMIELEPIVFLFVIVAPFVMAYILWDALEDRRK